MLDRLFKLREHKTTVGVEVLAGLATFLTAIYILVVNPTILAKTGMPVDAQFTATCIAIIIGTLLMGIFANLPFVLAPGMGINVFFTYSIVLGKGYSWQEALTATLIAGVLFVLAGLVGLREWLMRSFPETLKHTMTVALGLMIAMIGMKNCGLIEMKEGFISMGNVITGSPLLALIGIIITGVLLSLKVPAAVLMGIILTTLIGMFNGQTDYSSVAQNGALSMPPSIAPIFMAFDFNWGHIFSADFIIVVFTLLAVDIFDSLGTFVGVFNHFGGEERKEYESKVPRALMCDAVATVAGAVVGTSTVTTYVESSTGIAAGGRTGLTAVVIGILFILALFFSPLFLMVPAAATTPALMVVGVFMMAMAGRIRFPDVTDGIPAILTILVTCLTWSISDGLMYGWITFVIFKLFSGRTKELNLSIVIIGVFFLARLILL